MPPTHKCCRDCGETKPVEDFYAHPGMRDGYRNSCKACRNIQIQARKRLMMEKREWRQEKRARWREAAAKAWAAGRVRRPGATERPLGRAPETQGPAPTNPTREDLTIHDGALNV